jgi:hypothetical protein
LIFCGVVIEGGVSGAIIEGEKIFKTGVLLNQAHEQKPIVVGFASGFVSLVF